MNKKGFTLIELIAIIVIISVVALISIPTISSIINNSKDNLLDQQVSIIEVAAKKWGLDNINALPEDDSKSGCVSLSELQNNGYLDKDIVNPKTSKTIDGSVKITYLKNYKQYKYEYQNNSCGG